MEHFSELSKEMPMNFGQTLFAQLMSFLPWTTFRPGAIVKKRLSSDPSLYTLLQILSLTLFEKIPVRQALAGEENRCDNP